MRQDLGRWAKKALYCIVSGRGLMMFVEKLYLCNSKNEPFAAIYCNFHAVGQLFANGGAVVAACASRDN